MTERFVTISPHCGNVGILKDVGMIPYYMHKKYKYDSVLACYDQKDGYSYLKCEAKGLQVDFLQPILGNKWLGVVDYIRKNARDINILNVYHLSLKNSLMWALIYKLLNPLGIVYLKLDMGHLVLEKVRGYRRWKKRLIGYVLTRIDVVSAESRCICKCMEGLFDREILYIPNGFYFNNDFDIMARKRDIILTVGRIGAEEKATDILLEAFAKGATRHCWELRLVGIVTPTFENYLTDFFERYPDLRMRVSVVGEIQNKKELIEEYARAKIFVLPSKWESFGIVLVEALACGDYLIVSDKVSPAFDLTDDGKYGLICTPDIDSLSRKIEEAIALLSKEEPYMRIQSYASRYRWENIIQGIYDGMRR